MFNIDRYIEILLLKHDCVIVPGFGGFVAHHVSAQFDEADRTMLPPKTTVGFNQQLTMNDSLLVQSYIETYDYSYPEALRVINDEVAQLRSMIEEYGHFDINSVGRLSLNKDGNYEFEPIPAGILSPILYGLSGVSTTDTATFLNKEESAPKKRTRTHNIYPIAEERERFVRISTSAIRRGMVACIVILMLMVIPLLNRSVNTHQLMSGIDTSFFTSLVGSGSTSAPEKVGVKDVTNVQKQKSTKAEFTATSEITNNVSVAEKNSSVTENPVTKKAEQIKAEVKAETKEQYTVVLAARIAQVNADIYVDDLHKRGMKEAKVIGEGKSRKVVCGSYNSREEAQVAKNKLAAESEFEYAWVTKL